MFRHENLISYSQLELVIIEVHQGPLQSLEVSQNILNEFLIKF